MADQWWDSTAHRSHHGTSACSAAAPLLTVTGRAAACGWTTSPTAAAESTSSVTTFQDPFRSSSHHQPLSDAASSLGDPDMDWTQAFLNGRSDTSFQAVLQEPPAMNDDSLIRDDGDMSGAGFLVDHHQQQAAVQLVAPSPYGTEPPSQQALFDDTAAVHNISMYGDSESSVSYDAAATASNPSMQFPGQLLMKTSTPMQGVGAGAPMQYLSASSNYLPFGDPVPSQLLLQALQVQAKANSRRSNDTSVTVKDDCSPATRKSVSETPATTKRPRIEAPSPLPTFKVRKEKLGDRITALQQLVSPFGKTDTASVLHEAIEYIKFLHDQVASLSSPYLKNGIAMKQFQHKGSEDSKDDNGDTKHDLRSRGLCLVPVASTYTVAAETPEFWHPTFGGTFR